MRISVAALFMLIILSTSVTPVSTGEIESYNQDWLYDNMVYAWKALLNPFNIDISQAPDVYILCLITIFFILREFWGYNRTIKRTEYTGFFLVPRDFFHSGDLAILLASNWVLGFFIYLTESYHVGFDFARDAPSFLFDYIIPFLIIYYILFDIFTYFQPGFISLRVRRLVAFTAGMFAAELNMLTPVMKTIEDIMMANGLTIAGTATWTTYAIALGFIILARFLQKARTMFMVSQRDYIQMQVASARYQMYEALARNMADR